VLRWSSDMLRNILNRLVERRRRRTHETEKSVLYSKRRSHSLMSLLCLLLFFSYNTLSAAASYLGLVSIPPTWAQYPHPLLVKCCCPQETGLTYCRNAKRDFKGTSYNQNYCLLNSNCGVFRTILGLHSLGLSFVRDFSSKAI